MASKIEKMRDSLLQAIEDVKSGALSPEKAKAMASLAHQVTASLDVELRVMIAAKVGDLQRLVAQSEALEAPAPVTTPAAPRISPAPFREDAETVRTRNGTLTRDGGVITHRMGG